MKLQAFGKNILIKKIETETNPDDIQEAKAVADEICMGEIINMGGDVFTDSFRIEIGSKVLIAKDAGEEVEFEGALYKVIQAMHILCVLSEE